MGVTITTTATEIEIDGNNTLPFTKLKTRLENIEGVIQEDDGVSVYFEFLDRPIWLTYHNVSNFDGDTEIPDDNELYNKLDALI